MNNDELMHKFLKATEYIEEVAMDYDPCFLCGGAHCDKCEMIQKAPEEPLPPKKKDRYALLKEGNRESDRIN